MPDSQSGSDVVTPQPTDLESTATLLARARMGDIAARNLVAERYYPIIQRWAHLRLPPGARQMMDTGDLVQECLVRALDHMTDFEPRHEGALLRYLRLIVMNRIRDEIRRVRREPRRVGLREGMEDLGPSPLEFAIGRAALDAYEDALGKLTDMQREAVVLRIEMDFTYEQVSEAMALSTPNAARMLVSRALITLAEVIHERA